MDGRDSAVSPPKGASLSEYHRRAVDLLEECVQHGWPPPNNLVDLFATFAEVEREVRGQLGRMLAGGGFDPARDIEAITVNRWPHGYAYGYDPTTSQVAWTNEWPVGERPWLRAREPLGRIAVANSDAASYAMTEAAFGQAHRAISELLTG